MAIPVVRLYYSAHIVRADFWSIKLIFFLSMSNNGLCSQAVRDSRVEEMELDATLMISNHCWCFGPFIWCRHATIIFCFLFIPFCNFSSSGATLRLFRRSFSTKHRRSTLWVHQRRRSICIDFDLSCLNRNIVIEGRLLFILSAKHIDKSSLANSGIADDQNLKSFALELIYGASMLWGSLILLWQHWCIVV